MAKQGKILSLLKKLRFVDYLIIIILLLALVLFYKFVHHEQKIINVSAISYANVSQTNAIHIGDYETDSSGKKIAVVKSFEVVDNTPPPGAPFANKILILNLDLLVDISSKTNQVQYKNQALGAGSQIEFKLNSADINFAYISDIEGSSKKDLIQKIITVQIYNKRPWLADSINVGDSQIGIGGKKVLEVISKEVEPAQITNTTSNGESVATTDPLRVDITLKLKVLLQKVNNDYIFKGFYNVFIGKPLSISVGKTTIDDAIVTNIE